MSTKLIRDQIYNILNAMTAVSGTKKTTMNHIPQNVQEFEGYVFRIFMRSSTNSIITGYPTRTESQTWIIQLYSPRLAIDTDITENNMYDYRDAVLNEFQNNDGLVYSGSSVSSVSISNTLIRGDGFTWGTTEFFSPNGEQRYKWECNLNLDGEIPC